MTALEAGKRWRYQYIHAIDLPPVARENPQEFLLGVFPKDMTVAYATNREVLDRLQELLTGVGVTSDVRPFLNMEAKFGLYVDPAEFRRMAMVGDYQI